MEDQEIQATQPTAVGDPPISIEAISAEASDLKSSASLPPVLKDVSILIQGAATSALEVVKETVPSRALFSLQLAQKRVRAVLPWLEALVALAGRLDAFLRVELASRELAAVEAAKVAETPAD